MSVNIVANLRAAPGESTALRALLEHGREVSRSAAGCEWFRLYQRCDDPAPFMMVEQWASLEDHPRNMAANITATGHIDRIRAALAAPIDNGVIVEVGEPARGVAQN